MPGPQSRVCRLFYKPFFKIIYNVIYYPLKNEYCFEQTYFMFNRDTVFFETIMFIETSKLQKPAPFFSILQSIYIYTSIELLTLDEMYKNWPHEFNNWGFTGCMFVLFTLYCGMVKKLEGGQKSKASRAIFIQCSIICFSNTCVAIINVTLAFMVPPHWILTFCQLCWSVNHACPAFIHVTMNDTIRREFYQSVFRVKGTTVFF
ncbi:hypothetical protein CAEBREN_22945 [Caenorhabditis brenneri]|uniref:Uncharacterized protein n=1 Tax=Caenorhabditis brenneri TaxID=135651 RepID=G0P5E0_CAEBE|nr:hypothetical protein CAEBREN_22945 [Caenorhabditis brenneri]